jgi:23S rRNA pseudouridine2604 synthase
MTEAIRLAKRLAQQFGCSRSQAEHYIEGGWVTVDGAVVEDPAFHAAPEQTVTLLPGAVAEAVPQVTILLHKPSGIAADAGSDQAGLLNLLTPESRSGADDSRIRLLRRHRKDLQLGAGLGANASGLVVLSQEWRVMRKLKEDVQRIEHEYIVDVDGEISPAILALLVSEAERRGRASIKLSRQNEQRLRFAMKNLLYGAIGAFGAIEGICAVAGIRPLAVRRIRIGRVALAGLMPGEWRFLKDSEKF